MLPLLTLAAFGLAVWLARDRRRAVRGIGVVLVVVGLVGLAAARLTRNYVVDALVARRDDREAAGDAWDILTELMRGLVPADDRRRAPLPRRSVARRPRPTRADRSRLARAGPAESRAGRMSCSRSSGSRCCSPRTVLDFTRLLVVALIVALGADVDRADAQADAARVPRRAGHGVPRRHVGRACRAGGRSSAPKAASGVRPSRRRADRRGVAGWPRSPTCTRRAS